MELGDIEMDSETVQSDLGTSAGKRRYQPIRNALKYAYNNKDTVLDLLNAKTVKDVAEADPSNVQQVAASQLALLGNFYKTVLQQAQQSFLAALIASIIGLIFFIAAVSFLLLQKSESVSIISLVSGTLVEVIAGINFYLYGQTSKQFSTFHTRLERTQNFLLANSVCTNLLDSEAKETSRAELVRLIATASFAPDAPDQDEQKSRGDKVK